MICSEILAPDYVPEPFYNREYLWNAVEEIEKHPKAQLAYSFDFALQNEFSLEENITIARQFVLENFVAKGMIVDMVTVCELVDQYLKTKTGVRQSTKQGYVTVQRLLAKEEFGKRTIRSVKTSDAKLFLIKLQQEDGKSYSSIHTIRGVLRPAFQMAVDDDNGMPPVAMHWQHRFNHMVGRYNDIYRVQMPNITPHVCRHTYCSNMAKSGMNPKTLQYLMGHLDISVTMNVYTHIGFDDAEEELKRMEEFRKAQAEVEQKKEMPMSQKRFKVV